MKNKFLALLFKIPIFRNGFRKVFGYMTGSSNSSTLISNINLNLLKQQKRILFCYTTKNLNISFEQQDIFHPNIYRVNQMLNVFISLDFCIDACHCNDMLALDYIKDRRYDYLIGFGKVFCEMAKSDNIKEKILFITENNPEIVNKKFNERISYFKQRHPNYKTNGFIRRDQFYSIEQFNLANIGICINSEFNAQSMRKYFKFFYRINVNGFYNNKFIFKKNISEKRKCFVWFGSNGIIHKGLDILIDVFNKIPDYTLNVYGAPENEIKYLRKEARENIIFHGKISVFDERFITEVSDKNCFAISLSCSEGMNSGIATCMLHGIIPIVTKETGFDYQPFMIEITNFRVDNVINTLLKLKEIDDCELEKMSLETYIYAQKELTLENFDKKFRLIFSDIINKND